MSVEVIAALGIVAAAAVTGLVTWKVAKRTKSGAINTSEAATLWDEGTNMRHELRDEVVGLKAQLAAGVIVMTDLNREIRHSRQETEAAREETRLSREETRRLMEQISSLHSETKVVLEKTEGVLDEVKTSNALTLGALADNTESRRILDIPVGDRTAQEATHLRTAKDRLPDDKRASQGDEEP